jgi:hypothetical protein
MKKINWLNLLQIVITALMAGFMASAYSQEAQTMTIDQRVSTLKQSLMEDMTRIRQYEWIETTIISLKGEEKSRALNRCSYDPDGKVQKTLLTAPPEEKGKKGLRGKIAKTKKEEMTTYMTQAVNLVKSYVPPDPVKIQTAKDAGKFSIQMTEPGKRAKLEFRDYSLPGDVLGIEVDLLTNRLLGLQVSTYLEKPEDVVTMNASFNTLQDGTGYPAQIVLDVKAKEMNISIQNTDYKKAGL